MVCGLSVQGVIVISGAVSAISNVQPVILCGGSGTRLWPSFRLGFPKQFLRLTGQESLLQPAAARLAGLGTENVRVAAPLIATGEEHRFLGLEQLRETGIDLQAALAALENGEDPILVDVQSGSYPGEDDIVRFDDHYGRERK